MSASPTQRAFQIYEIVENILLFNAHISLYKEMMHVRRTCSTWIAVIKSPFKIRESMYLSVSVLTLNEKRAVGLDAGLDMLMWVCNFESRESLHLYPITGSRDLYCEGRTSCLDMPLVWPSATNIEYWEPHPRLPYPATWQPRNETQWRSLEGLHDDWQYTCKTVKDVVQVAISHHEDIQRPKRVLTEAQIQHQHTEVAFTFCRHRGHVFPKMPLLP